MRFWTVAIAALLVFSCKRRSEPADLSSREIPPGELSEILHGDWPPSGELQVTGYGYEVPGSAENTSFLRGRTGEDGVRLHHAGLVGAVRSSKKLSAPQIERLLTASFSDEAPAAPAACYLPRHIFVFQKADGTVTQAVEVCFECMAIRVFPEPPGGAPPGHLKKLAELCDELGLWAEDQPVAEYLSDAGK